MDAKANTGTHIALGMYQQWRDDNTNLRRVYFELGSMGKGDKTNNNNGESFAHGITLEAGLKYQF
jgi:hypothetical protein